MAEREVVVDIDAHYLEDPRAFAQYLPEPWKTRIATWTGSAFTPQAFSTYLDSRTQGRIRRDPPGGQVRTPEDALRVMSYLGVDIAVLLPGSMLRVAELPHRDQAVALCNGFIDHMLDRVVDPNKGLYTLIVLPTQSVPGCVELIERVGDRRGVCGVMIMTIGPSVPLGDPHWDPVYDACCRYGLPVILHSFSGGSFAFQTYAEHQLGFVTNAQVQLQSIVLQGVQERFPQLKIVFEETGVFWIPLMMYRLDTFHSMHRSDAPLLKMPPSEYIKQLFFGTQPLERVPTLDHLRAVFDMVGAGERLMFATDWPHSDFDSPSVIRRLPFLNDEEKRSILGGNAIQALKLELPVDAVR